MADTEGTRNDVRTVAVVLAGGIGVRVGLGIPKQMIKIAGKTVLEHTLAVFQAHPRIDEIVLMMTPGHVEQVAHLAADPSLSKLSVVLPGGSTRNETTRKALDHLGDEDALVLLHDAVRPFLDERTIDRCIDALQRYDAVDTAIPSADTIVKVSPDDHIESIPDRSTLRRGQTPQAFRASVLARAYRIADEDPDFAATDDCGVVHKYLPDVPILVVDGSAENMKITEPIDVHLADKLFQLRTAEIVEPSLPLLRERLQGKVLVVFGGSYGIGAEIAKVAEEAGATVHTFSRSETGTDVKSRAAVSDALVSVAKQTGGRIDYVANTSGLLQRGRLADLTSEEIQETLDVNLLGPILVAQQAFPYLQRTAGQLLFFTSSSYTRGRAGYSLYSATKSATVNLTQALADEWAEYGIRVNCINPERTRTPMREQAFGEETAGTLLDPRSVALSSLATLTSDLTGQVVDVRLQQGHQA
jgi:2-C-methyl-D-erythritol 4-phosphate cytidylyltransferase